MLSNITKRTGESIYMVIGGSHLVKSNEERINQTIECLREQGIRYIGMSHCTGDKATKILEQELPGYFSNNTGTVIEIGKYGEVTIN